MRTVHLWLGLSLGALFLVLGITGAALVFYPEIDAALHPEMQAAAADSAVQGTAPDWDRAMATVRRTWPEKQGPWRFEVTRDGGPIPARYYNPPERAGHDFAPMMVWLSPDGGRVLRRDYWGDYAMTFLYDLHYRMLAGRSGGIVLGYAGIATTLLLLSGLWSWWPRGRWAKALRYKHHADPVRRWRDQHKLAGLIGLPLLLILTVTGVMLELPEESDAVLAAVAGPPDPMIHAHSRAGSGAPVPVRTALAAAHRALPLAIVRWIEVPGPGDGAFRFRVQQPNDPSPRFPHSFVWVDRYRGTVIGVQDSMRAGTATTINNWVHPLHDGSFGGAGTRWLTLVIGVVPAVLFVTGWRRWRLRRDRR